MDPKRLDPDGSTVSTLADGQMQSAGISELAGYRLIATLGQGGTAKVYLALKQGPAGFTKLVVIKALRREHVDSLEHVEMFLDEARLSAQLNHPNLVQTFEVGDENGRYYIEMEYLAGQALRDVQRRVPRSDFTVALQLKVLSEVARGLHYAHELRGYDQQPLGIVHRDVTPHNVLLTYDGHVKLLDFGIAKAENNEHLTQAGMVKGKADYVSPEQVRGAAVDRRADIFALGVMAHEAVTGRAFSGGSKIPVMTRLHRRLTGAEPRVRELDSNIPGALADLIDSCTAVDPDARLATAAEFADHVDAFLERTRAQVAPSVLARLMSAPFAPDRERLDELVEMQTRSAAEREDTRLDRYTSLLPIVEPNNTPSGMELRTSLVEDYAHGGADPAAAADPAAPPGSGSAPTGHATGRQQLDLAGDSVDSMELNGSGQPAQRTQRELAAGPLPSQRPGTVSTPVPGGRGMTHAFALTLAGAALAAAAALWLQRGPAPETVPVSAPAAPTPPPSSAAGGLPGEIAAATAPRVHDEQVPGSADVVGPEMVRIKIQVVPHSAHVSLDGAALETPADLSLEKSDRVHLLKASAPGFVPLEREISQLRDANLHLRLHREPRRDRASRVQAGPRRQARPAEASSAAEGASAGPGSEARGEPTAPGARLVPPTRPGRLPRATIDLEDPYQ